MAIKHRQLARQVGVFIEHPPENSMTSFSFTSTVLDEGTTFIFGSWIYITNGSGGFNGHLANSRKPEVSTPTPCSDVDKFVDSLDESLLPNHAGEIETLSVFNATSTRAAPGLLGSDPRRLHGPNPSLIWRSTWIIFSSLEMREPPPVEGGGIFDNYSDSNEKYSLPSTIPSSRSLGGLGDKRAVFSTTTRSQMTIPNPFRVITWV
jgi:hypothetical protein